MSAYLEPESNNRDKAKSVLYLSNYETKKQLEDATDAIKQANKI